MFSVADGVLLRPLPFPHSDDLVHVWMTRPAEGEWRGVVAGATYLDWERDARAFERLAAYRPMDFNVTGGAFPVRVAGVSITVGFFGVLEIHPALGRRLAESLPRARAVTRTGGDHVPFRGAEKETAALVGEFIGGIGHGQDRQRAEM